MLKPGSTVGDYVIEEQLGVGGMARVYRARHAVLETLHALKVLEPEYRVNAGARQRFLEEARIQAKHLDHPGIVKVTNIVATDEHAALVMELVDGGNLERQLAELRRRPDEVRRIMLAILDAVGHAHAAGIIHRDLKPANVLLARKGDRLEPKVTDFGIAKVKRGDGEKGKKSTHGDARMGTISYMSPEQIRRSKDVTPRSDVFSLGVMLYELSTGEVPFGGDSDYDVMDAVVNGRYRPPEEVDPRIEPTVAAVIRRALEPDPLKRFASCEEMAAALRGAPVARNGASGLGPRASAQLPSAPPSPPRNLALPLAIGGFVIGAVIVVVALVATRDSRRPAPAAAIDAGVAAIVEAPIDAAPLPPRLRCPDGMVLVPGGTFTMGSPDGVGDSDEHPAHPVTLSTYCIDRTEVTVAAYFACAVCSVPPTTVDWKDLARSAKRLWDKGKVCNGNQAERQDHPINCVTWDQADAFCRAADKQLPTAAQWEYAARGSDGRTYPWGDAPPSARLLNACEGACARYVDRLGFTSKTLYGDDDGAGGTAPVGSYPDGASPFGVLDLAGNVAEWVADEYGPVYEATPLTDPPPAATDRPMAEKHRNLRGGNWLTFDASHLRSAYQAWALPAARDMSNGFRCASAPIVDEVIP